LDLENYFSYAKIPKDFKVLLVSSKFECDAADWWNDEGYSKMRKGKPKIFSWPSMK
jgi:hypothetical protein